MFATIRQYEGIENPNELTQQVIDTFLPTQREIPDFLAYYFVDVGEAGGRMVSISVFEDESGTARSNAAAAEWVAEHPGLIPPAVRVEAGHVVAGA